MNDHMPLDDAREAAASWPNQAGDPRPRTDADQVNRIQVTLRPDYVAFHATYCKPYLRFAHAQLGSKQRAVQAVEEAFHQLALVWPQVLRQERPQAYAWRVVKDIVDRFRAANRHDVALVATAAFAKLRQVYQNEFAVMESRLGLFTAISRLPDRRFDAVVLVHVLGYTTDQAADMMGVVEATVRSHLRYAKRHLADELGIPYTDDLRQ